MPSTPNRGRTLAVIGSVLLFAPAVSLAMVAQGVAQLFRKAADGHPEMLMDADAVGRAVGGHPAVAHACLALGLLGLALACTALFAFRYARPWFWWVLFIAPNFWITLWYVGMIWIVAVLVWRKKFRPPPARHAPGEESSLSARG